MLAKYKFQILLLVILIAGGLAINSVLKSYSKSEAKRMENQLEQVHAETVVRIETGIDVYNTMVSSLRSFIRNSPDFPSEERLQSFLSDLVDQTGFQDSIVVSWVSPNQTFQYCFTPDKIDPFKLKGIKVASLRPPAEIAALNEMMEADEIMLFPPINLVENWAAFPFNFSARSADGESRGYIACVVNLKYLLDNIYKVSGELEYVHRFCYNDSLDFTREAVYDGTLIYNTNSDPEYYKNFKDHGEFVYTNLDFNDLNIKVGTAYKVQQ